METDVVIVGAGPVGLTLAIDLAQRGVEVVVIELRERGEPPSVKCNHVSARSMEIFRRLGFAAEVRNAGLPVDYPHDIAFRTTMTGHEIARIPIPSRGDRYTATEGPDTDWPTPEPPHRINQIYMEPIIFEIAWETPGLTILNRTRFDRFEQDEGGVQVYAEDLNSADSLSLRSSFLVGCDGGRSNVRRQIGATLSGDAVIQRVQSTFIEAPELIKLLKTKPAWGNLSLNARRSGTVYAIDGVEKWLIHNYLREDEEDFDAVDRDWAIRTILGVDDRFQYRVISKEDWFGRRLLADKFRDRRVFICGDAAHLWVPFAGYGMNAGIADAENLAWLLGAHLNGWAPAAILDAHEAERHPITEQVSFFAMNHAFSTARQRRAVPPEIEDDTPEGEAARRALGRETYALNVQQYACAGLNFGYYYEHSPIIAYDGEPHEPYSMASYTPSTVPGSRLPHEWIDGKSLYDQLGAGYTLLRLDPAVASEALEDAARRQALPLTVLDIPRAEVGDAYQTKLVLSRPDRHVAWRGDELPADADGLVRMLRGVGT